MVHPPGSATILEEAVRHPLWAVWDFLVEIVVATAIFGVVAGGAVSLDFLNGSLEAWGIDPYVRAALKITEYAVLAVDLLLFLVFLGKSCARAARRL